jgi:hypothetical protein
VNETTTQRCGYDVQRDPGTQASRFVRIATNHGDLHLETAIYDTVTDEEFTNLVEAWLADDASDVDEHVEVARERHPGLTSLKQASDRHARDRAIEHAIRALDRHAPAGIFMAGQQGATTSDFADSIIDVAMRLGDYIENGLR